MDQLNLEKEKNKVFLRFGRCRSLLHSAARVTAAVWVFALLFVYFLPTFLGCWMGNLSVILKFQFFSCTSWKLNKHVFICMLAVEEEISFPPTYRYERGSRDTYVWQKQKATGVRFPNSLSSLMSIHPLYFFFIPLIVLILLCVCV